MNQFSGIAPADEIERFQHGYSLTRPMMLDPKYNDWRNYTGDFTTNGKKTYYVKVEKMCSAYLYVEAEDEQKAKELAENLKNNFVLDWK